MSADGLEQRSAEFAERSYDHDLAAGAADEARDVIDSPPRLITNASLAAQIDDIASTAMGIKRQRDSLAQAVRDLLFGAEMLEPLFTGAALKYIQEVKRMSAAALDEAGL